MIKSDASKKAKSNLYADIPLNLQISRCGFAVFSLGMAIFKLPDNMKGQKKDQATLDRVIKWHGTLCEQMQQYAMSKLGKLAIETRIKQIEGFLNKYSAEIKYAARFFGTAMLVWDCRLMCPTIANNKEWRLLDNAVYKFAEYLISKIPQCEEAAVELYEKICWVE